MQQIEILNELPVVFTKDKNWMRENHMIAKPGHVFLLPEDAVLAMCPQIIIQEVEKIKPKFVECAECAAKPGSPILCNDCILRRDSLE